jgi:membrane associated rhomboid family serine protease
MAWHSTWNEPPEQPRRGGWFGRPRSRAPGLRAVLIITVAVFVLDVATKGMLSSMGALTVDSVLHLQVWRLFTYQFLHAGTMHIFWNMFILWMLGQRLEEDLGTRQFLALYFAGGVFGGVCEVLFNMGMHAQFGAQFYHATGMTFLNVPAVGASAGVAGVLVAFAVLYPRALFLLFFLIPIEARWLAIAYLVITSISVWQGLAQGRLDNVAHAAHLGGMVMGFVWMKWGARIACWWQMRRAGARRQVVDRSREAEQAEVDRILEKIHEHGTQSLTLREKMFLQEMSQKYRDR